MIKIISMDFDGTLLTSKKKITKRTRNCLINFKDKGYIIIGVTARNLSSVKDILDVSLFNYIILNNGSDIYYVKEDRVESVSSIEKDIAQKIYNLCEKDSYRIDFCTPYNYLFKTDKKSDNRSFVKYIDGLDEVNDSISRMNIYFEDSKELEEKQIMIEKTFNNISVVKMIDTDVMDSQRWLTINPKNVNKLNTLKKICVDLNCSVDEVIFFGDSGNDLVLIENVGIGVAMENAIDIVKEKASFITLSNDNDGIAEYLERELL